MNGSVGERKGELKNIRVHVLTTNTETPVVTETSVDTVTLKTFKIVTECGINSRGDEVHGLAGIAILLAVEGPSW